MFAVLLLLSFNVDAQPLLTPWINAKMASFSTNDADRVQFSPWRARGAELCDDGDVVTSVDSMNDFLQTPMAVFRLNASLPANALVQKVELSVNRSVTGFSAFAFSNRAQKLVVAGNVDVSNAFGSTFTPNLVAFTTDDSGGLPSAPHVYNSFEVRMRATYTYISFINPERPSFVIDVAIACVAVRLTYVLTSTVATTAATTTTTATTSTSESTSTTISTTASPTSAATSSAPTPAPPPTPPMTLPPPGSATPSTTSAATSATTATSLTSATVVSSITTSISSSNSSSTAAVFVAMEPAVEPEWWIFAAAGGGAFVLVAIVAAVVATVVCRRRQPADDAALPDYNDAVYSAPPITLTMSTTTTTNSSQDAGPYSAPPMTLQQQQEP